MIKTDIRGVAGRLEESMYHSTINVFTNKVVRGSMNDMILQPLRFRFVSLMQTNKTMLLIGALDAEKRRH